MAVPRIVEIDHVELDVRLVLVLVLEQMVIDDKAQVRELEIIAVKRIAFLYLLLDELVDDTVALPAARRTDHHAAPLGQYDVDPPIVPFLLVITPPAPKQKTLDERIEDFKKYIATTTLEDMNGDKYKKAFNTLCKLAGPEKAEELTQIHNNRFQFLMQQPLEKE